MTKARSAEAKELNRVRVLDYTNHVSLGVVITHWAFLTFVACQSTE